MKNQTIFGLLLIVGLAGCGILSPASPSLLPTSSLPAILTKDTLTSIPHSQSSPTLTATVVTLTPTVTINPLAVPHLAAETSIDLTHIQMLDAQNGWGIGAAAKSGLSSHVFRTVDGGSSWMDVTPPESIHADPSQAAAVGFFSNSSTGWVTFHGLQPSQVPAAPVVWKTADGGKTWQASTPLNTSDLQEVYWVSDVFFTGSTGWILAHVGAGMNHDYVALYQSTDDGMNWTRIIDPYSDGGVQSCTKTGMFFMNSTEGWLTGNCNGVAPGALLFRTGDGGKTWQHMDLPAPTDNPEMFTAMEYACGIRAPSAYGNTLYLVVECDKYTVTPMTTVPYLYYSSNGGATWSYLSYPGGNFKIVDGSNGWALGKDIFRTKDGGQNWTKISTVTWEGQFSFIDAQMGWAIAMKDNGYSLVQTTDGGSLWSKLNPIVVAGP